MNSSFVKDDVEIPSISRRDLFIIFVAGLVSGSLGGIRYHRNHKSQFSNSSLIAMDGEEIWNDLLVSSIGNKQQ